MPYSFGWSFQLNCIFLLLLLITDCAVHAVRLSGTIQKQNRDRLNGEFGWQFLGRFAFDNSGKARFNGKFTVGAPSAATLDSGIRHFLAFYRDGDGGKDGWPLVYNAAELSCMNKVAFSRFQATLALGSTTVYDFTVTSASRASYWCSPSIAR
jgi:hypothetical protein